jgi:DNA modification methylase
MKTTATNTSAAYPMPHRIELWQVSRLNPSPGNPRTHSEEQVAQIAASIVEFGFTNPILVDSKNCIIAGHGRLLAAITLGLNEVPVIVLDHLTDAQKRAYVLADNQLALNGGWDEDLLRSELAALQQDNFDISLVGFDDEKLAQLLAAQAAADGLTDEDAVPALPDTPISRTGDRWNMASHRLVVGDATVPAHVEKLMADDTADLAFLDPPYNVSYEGYTEEHLTMRGDQMSVGDYKQFLESAFRSCRSIVKPGASLYICHPSSWQREFQNALEAAGFEIRCQIIWAKNTFAWGFGRYKFRHEPIFYCHVSGQKDPWYGDKTQSTLWEENKPAANRIHPTAKPCELIERALLNSTKSGDIVVDLFAGSGSTMIACERRGRAARLMEIDEKYADCIIRRYEEYTGRKAVLEGDGRTFEEVAEERRREAAA